MPLELATVDECLLDIRGDEEADGPWLEQWIPIVSETVRAYLKEDWRMYLPARDSSGEIVVGSDGDQVPDTDGGGDPIVHPSVNGAVRAEIAYLYRFRDEDGGNRGRPDEYGFGLCRTAVALLAGRRKPTVL